MKLDFSQDVRTSGISFFSMMGFSTADFTGTSTSWPWILPSGMRERHCCQPDDGVNPRPPSHAHTRRASRTLRERRYLHYPSPHFSLRPTSTDCLRTMRRSLKPIYRVFL